MSVRRKQLCEAELRQLSVTIGRVWASGSSSTFSSMGVLNGNAPALAELDKVDKLTKQYKQAQELFEQGHYLSCLEVLTAEEAS